MISFEDLKVGQDVRGVFLDDEPDSDTFGSAETFEGRIIGLETEAYGGPYVVVDDGKTLWLADVLEIVEVLA